MSDSDENNIMNQPSSYDCHDYRRLIRRWRSLVASTELCMKKFTIFDGFPCYEVSTSGLSKSRQVVYLSAGIHGDEPASCEGLLRWAEGSLSILNKLSFIIYPCLNPWGLKNNSRLDASGIDLNRAWQKSDHELIGPILQKTRNLKMDLVVTLHEDYEGQGIYLYEPSKGGRPNGNAHRILNSASKVIPKDLRKMIDGRKARDGVIRPRPSSMPSDGTPEALHFFSSHECPALTLESPSEFDFHRRTKAHRLMLEECIQLYR